jgi:hypothetical protein
MRLAQWVASSWRAFIAHSCVTHTTSEGEEVHVILWGAPVMEPGYVILPIADRAAHDSGRALDGLPGRLTRREAAGTQQASQSPDGQSR